VVDGRHLALTLPVVLAGCAGWVGGGSTTETPAVPADATAGNTVAVGNLTDEERAAFREARNGTASFDPCGGGYDPAYSWVFRTHEYVRQGETYYRIDARRAGLVGRELTFELRPGDPGESATVADFGDLSSDERRAVREAIAARYAASAREDPPPVFSGADYVRRGNETYEVRKRGLGVLRWSLTVTERP
jgi:uncharacterized membrane protein